MNNLIGYNGVQYDSLKELCRAYNIKYGTVYQRLKRGVSLQEAIETPVKQANSLFEGTKHSNGEILEMCKAHGIEVATVKARIKTGMSLEEAIKTPVRRRKTITDNGVRHYESASDLCREHNIDYAAAKKRLDRIGNSKKSH